MLSSISPVGEAARGQRWAVTVTMFTLASVIAGAVVGGVLAAVGLLLAVLAGATGPAPVWPLASLALVAVIGALIDSGRLPVTVPTWRRQVDQRWLTSFRGWVYGAGYGAQLGAGVVTVVPTAATYGALLAALLAGAAGAGWPAGIVVGASFGLGRAVPVLATARWTTPQRLRASYARFDRRARWARPLAVGGQLIVAVVALGGVALPALGS